MRDLNRYSSSGVWKGETKRRRGNRAMLRERCADENCLSRVRADASLRPGIKAEGEGFEREDSKIKRR